MVGLLIAALVWLAQSTNTAGRKYLSHRCADQPGAGIVRSDQPGGHCQDVNSDASAATKISFKRLGKPFLVFMLIVGAFRLGNSSDAFLVLRTGAGVCWASPAHAGSFQPDLCLVSTLPATFRTILTDAW